MEVEVQIGKKKRKQVKETEEIKNYITYKYLYI